jgi:hypothetical protein
MKWIVLGAFAFVIFLVFRRINREQRSANYPSEPAQPTPVAAPTQTEFALRAPMSFDEFYRQYYANDNLDREFVQKILAYVAHAGGVPAEQLRPEDRLHDLPKRSAYFGMKMVEKFVGGALQNRAREQGVDVPELHLDTVDSLIRSLEPHHLELLKSQVFSRLDTHSGQ